MINSQEHKIISKVMEMLEEIDPLLLSTGSMFEAKWINDTGYVTVNFTNEHDEWIYEVEVE